MAGPKDGQRFTILHGDKAVFIGITKPAADGFGLVDGRRLYQRQRIGWQGGYGDARTDRLDPRGSVTIWVSEELTIGDAVERLVAGYYSALAPPPAPIASEERIARGAKAIEALQHYIDGGFYGGRMAREAARAVIESLKP